MIDTIIDFMSSKENQDTIAMVAGYIWSVASTTVVGASVVTAVTKTRSSKLYKLVELCAIVTKKVKEDAKK